MKEIRKTEWTMFLIGVIGMLLIAGVFLFGTTDALAKEQGRRYINIGGNPVNPNAMYAGEVKQSLDREVQVLTTDAAGRRVQGWLQVGEELIFAQEASGKWVATRIYRCGNPILNRIVLGGGFQQPVGQPYQQQQVVAPPAPPHQYAAQPQQPVSLCPASSPPGWGCDPRTGQWYQISAQQAGMAPSAPYTPKEKKCLGKGTFYTGLGSFMVAGGLATGGWGYGVAALGLVPTYYGLTDRESDPVCKSLAAIIGGAGGLVAGKAIDREIDNRDREREDEDRRGPGPDPPADPTLLPERVGQLP